MSDGAGGATYMAHDGKLYQWPPPPGFWQASDGRWYPPQQSTGTPPEPDAKPRRSMGRQVLIFAGFSVAALLLVPVLAGLANVGSGDDSDGQRFSGVEQPIARTDGSGWGTTFLVWAPPGAYELGESLGSTTCRLVDEDAYQVVTNAGVVVGSADFATAFDSEAIGSLVFDRTGVRVRESDDYCRLRGALISADLSRIGSSYTVTNGTLSATYTDGSFLSGQLDGEDAVGTFRPTN